MPVSPPLYRLVYESHAASPLRQADLNTLLHGARLHNQATQFSGVLLYADGRFLQVLEGPEPALSDLYARIQADPRHQQVRTLAYGPVAARAFSDWHMGFVAAEAAFFGQISGYLPLADAPDHQADLPEDLAQLLRDFAQGQGQAK